jgi:hypothetical protein
LLTVRSAHQKAQEEPRVLEQQQQEQRATYPLLLRQRPDVCRAEGDRVEYNHHHRNGAEDRSSCELSNRKVLRAKETARSGYERHSSGYSSTQHAARSAQLHVTARSTKQFQHALTGFINEKTNAIVRFLSRASSGKLESLKVRFSE